MLISSIILPFLGFIFWGRDWDLFDDLYFPQVLYFHVNLEILQRFIACNILCYLWPFCGQLVCQNRTIIKSACNTWRQKLSASTFYKYMSLRKKWSQNSSFLEPFWKMVPLWRAELFFLPSLKIHFMNYSQHSELSYHAKLHSFSSLYIMGLNSTVCVPGSDVQIRIRFQNFLGWIWILLQIPREKLSIRIQI